MQKSNLFVISGGHKAGDCPLYNTQSAKAHITAAQKNIPNIAKQYQIQNIVGQYHANNHDITWIVEANDSVLVKQFFVDIGLGDFNTISVIPMTTFNGLNIQAKQIHNIF